MAQKGVNKVTILGNVGKDPEVHQTNDGKDVVNLTMATSESWKAQSGELQEKTEWHRIVFFGGLASIVAKYIHKGSKIYIEGKLQTRKWQDQSGNDRYTTEIVVDGFSGVMQMLDSKPGGQQAPQQQAPQQQQQHAGGAQNAAVDSFDGDIPFSLHERGFIA